MTKCSHNNKGTMTSGGKRIVYCKDCGETLKVTAIDK